MPSSCFDPSDLIIPAFDTSASTAHIGLDVHPGQLRILNYLAGSNLLPFRNREDVARFAMCFGTHALLISIPSGFAILEAKLDLLQDERFQRQKDCLSDSVLKYLAAGELENARRVVLNAFEEYRRIPTLYWRNLWLSTL